MKMWKKMFGKKDKKFEEAKPDAKTDDLLKAQDAPRAEPLRGTEAEIEKQAEEGMAKMGFKPAEEKGEVSAEKEPVNVLKPRRDGFKPRIRGNDYCPCGSGKKLKKCCALDVKKLEKFQKFLDIQLVNAEATSRAKTIADREKKRAEALKKAEEAKTKTVEVEVKA